MNTSKPKVEPLKKHLVPDYIQLHINKLEYSIYIEELEIERLRDNISLVGAILRLSRLKHTLMGVL